VETMVCGRLTGDKELIMMKLIGEGRACKAIGFTKT